METIKVTVVKISGYREPIVYKSEDWELLKPLAIGIEIEKEYIIDPKDFKDFVYTTCKVFNMVNEGRYHSSVGWITRFRDIISKVNQEDK